jgi:hypothetical protein
MDSAKWRRHKMDEKLRGREDFFPCAGRGSGKQWKRSDAEEAQN